MRRGTDFVKDKYTDTQLNVNNLTFSSCKYFFQDEYEGFLCNPVKC
jgi:hypothetical protein